MATFGAHVVWHVLYRRDKVTDSLLACGLTLNAKHECKTARLTLMLLMAGLFTLSSTHIVAS